MSIFYPYHLPSFPLENNLSNQPLDLSSRTLEKKVIQQFKDQVPIQQISKKLDLSIDKIYSIISKTSSIRIKVFGKYTSNIKYRVKEAQNKGKTLSETAKIFNLNLQQVIYINYLNGDNPANLARNKGRPSPTTIKKLKALLHRRRIQSQRKI